MRRRRQQSKQRAPAGQTKGARQTNKGRTPYKQRDARRLFNFWWILDVAKVRKIFGICKIPLIKNVLTETICLKTFTVKKREKCLQVSGERPNFAS